jgi:hypothetical protein
MTTVGGLAIAPATQEAGAITIGGWTIEQDGSGQLLITNGTQTFAVGGAGPTFQGNRMICDHDPVAIWCQAWDGGGGAWLNGTNAHGSGDYPSDWQAWTYWMGSGDWASNLLMRYGNFW